MPMILIPGESEHYEGTDWWEFRALVHGQAFTGSNNEPLLVTADAPSGEREHWVLKPLGKLGEIRSICELVGHRFARALELPVIDFGIVNVAEQTMNASAALRDRFNDVPGPAFATRYRPGVVDLFSANEVKANQRSVATEIYGWDALTDNVDRRLQRSNLLASDDGLIAIDHELTFSWYTAIGSPGPAWVVSILHRLSVDHFLCRHVPRWGCNLDGLQARLTALTSSELEALTERIPSRWLRSEGAEFVDALRAYLRDIHARAEAIVPKIESWRAA